MRRKILVLLVTTVTMMTLVGCGNKAISNDIISISQYEGLKVDESSETFKDDVWDALLANCVVEEYPQEELETLISELETEYSYVAYYKGVTASEWIQELHGMTTEELAKEQLKKAYAVALIAETENLNLTSQEYEERVQEEAEASGLESGAEYESMFGQEELMQMYLEERVLNFLTENLK